MQFCEFEMDATLLVRGNYIKVKIVAIDIEFNTTSTFTPFHSSRTLPLRNDIIYVYPSSAVLFSNCSGQIPNWFVLDQ